MSFGLTVQQLGSDSERLLVVGRIAGARDGGRWFAPRDVISLFEALRVPAPRSLHYGLGRLVERQLVLRREGTPSWALTATGDELVEELVGSVDLHALEAELMEGDGATLGEGAHAVLPPWFAPTRWRGAIRQMLRSHPFETNVFCMTRFPENAQDTHYLDPVSDVIPIARTVLAQHGLRLHVASERQLDDDLFGNIAAHMWACRFGIALFEDRMQRGLNQNMLVEIGAMLATGRRCALLRDRTVKRMPTDFVGQIYKPVDFDDRADVAAHLHAWIAEDLGLGRCETCPAAADAA